MEGVFQTVCLAPFIIAAEPLNIQVCAVFPVVYGVVCVLAVKHFVDIVPNVITKFGLKGIAKILRPREIVFLFAFRIQEDISVNATVISIREETTDAITKILTQVLFVGFVDNFVEQQRRFGIFKGRESRNINEKDKSTKKLSFSAGDNCYGRKKGFNMH